MANKAAWLKEAKAYPFEIEDAPMPVPEAHQLILKAKAVAFNPADVVIQFQGVLVNDFPSILGEDVAGEVVEIGAEVTRFKVGDRVTAVAADVRFGKAFSGSFQLFVKINDDLAAEIPDNITYNEASVLPLGLCTAAAALFEKNTLALPLPQLSPKPNGSTLLIWGGSSSVGSCAIQLARAAGLDIATTCSPRNKQYCRELGAKHVFDYKSADIVAEITTALKNEQSPGVLCAVRDPDSLKACAQIAIQLDGKNFLQTMAAFKQQLPEGLPSEVQVGLTFSTYIRNSPVGPATWENWLTSALSNGSMKCKPDPEVVGQGLESIQNAMDLMQKGVSAKKLVVEL